LKITIEWKKALYTADIYYLYTVRSDRCRDAFKRRDRCFDIYIYTDIYVYTVVLIDDKFFWVLYCHCSTTCDFPSMFKVDSSQLSQIFSCHQPQHQHHRTFIGSKIMLCIWWDQKSLVYYELLKPDDSVTGDRYQLRLIDPCIVWAVHCKKNGWNTGKDVIKLFFFMTTLGLMSLKSKKIWKKWDILPAVFSRHCSWLLIIPKNAASYRFTSFAEIENWLQNWIASKDESFFRDGIRK